MKTAAYRHPSPAFLADLNIRRERLYKLLGNKICLLQAAPIGSSSVYHRTPYKQDADFMHLTGLYEENCIALFDPNSTEKFKLFMTPVDKNSELWNGPMTSLELAVQAFGAQGCYPLSDLKNHLKESFKKTDTLYLNLKQQMSSHETLADAMRFARVESAGVELRHTRRLIGQLRLIKSEWEITNLRKAGALGSEMHKIAMLKGAPGVYEFEIQAALESHAKSQGSVWMGYPSIVASGPNACCLHYGVNNCVTDSGDLVLVDAGCEWENLTCDITRTWPANGRFSKQQKSVYDIVLLAQTRALAIVKPGVTLKTLEDLATETLVEGLLELGLIVGNAKEIIENKLYKELYPHSIGHWLGADVHDVGHYFEFGTEMAFKEGMCFTVEPGIYVPLKHELATQYRGIGVRIEDNVVVTSNGHENLSPCLKVPSEIEAFIADHRTKK